MAWFFPKPVNISDKFVEHVIQENAKLRHELYSLKGKFNKEKICYDWCQKALILFFLSFFILIALDVLNKLESEIIITYLQSMTYPILAIIIGMLICYHDGLKGFLRTLSMKFTDLDKEAKDKKKAKNK